MQPRSKTAPKVGTPLAAPMVVSNLGTPSYAAAAAVSFSSADTTTLPLGVRDSLRSFFVYSNRFHMESTNNNKDVEEARNATALTIAMWLHRCNPQLSVTLLCAKEDIQCIRDLYHDTTLQETLKEDDGAVGVGRLTSKFHICDIAAKNNNALDLVVMVVKDKPSVKQSLALPNVRCGLYVVGDYDLLFEHCWAHRDRSIWETFESEEQNNHGPSFPCQCPIHNEVAMDIVFGAEVNLPKCTMICGDPLPHCEHHCQKGCHWEAPEGHGVCEELCGRSGVDCEPPRGCAHVCAKHCGVACGKCTEQVRYVCPVCGSTQMIECHQLNDPPKCEKVVHDRCEVNNNHHVTARCSQWTEGTASAACRKEPCAQKMPCHHTCSDNCHAGDPDHKIRAAQCTKLKVMTHPSCNRHQVRVPCNYSGPCPEVCDAPVGTCGHKCELTCHEGTAQTPHQCLTGTFDWAGPCGHTHTVLCQHRDTFACPTVCTFVHPCGHHCENVCSARKCHLSDDNHKHCMVRACVVENVNGILEDLTEDGDNSVVRSRIQTLSLNESLVVAIVAESILERALNDPNFAKSCVMLCVDDVVGFGAGLHAITRAAQREFVLLAKPCSDTQVTRKAALVILIAELHHCKAIDSTRIIGYLQQLDREDTVSDVVLLRALGIRSSWAIQQARAVRKNAPWSRYGYGLLLGIRGSSAVQEARHILRQNGADVASQLRDISVMDRLLEKLTETNAAELVPQVRSLLASGDDAKIVADCITETNTAELEPLLEPFLSNGNDAKIVADCIVAKALHAPKLAKSCVALCVDEGLRRETLGRTQRELDLLTKPCSNRQITRKAALMVFIAELYHCKKIAPQRIVCCLRDLLINEDHKDTVAGVELLRALGICSSGHVEKAMEVLRENGTNDVSVASQLHDIIVRNEMDGLLGTLTETNTAELEPQLEPFLSNGNDAKIVADCIVAKALHAPKLAKSCVTLCVDEGLRRETLGRTQREFKWLTKPCSKRQITRKAALMVFIAELYHCKKIAPQRIVCCLRDLLINEDHKDTVAGVELLRALGICSSGHVEKAMEVLRENGTNDVSVASQLHDIIVRNEMDGLLGTLTETNTAELEPQLEPFLSNGNDAKIVADCIVAKALHAPKLAKSCVTLCVDEGLRRETLGRTQRELELLAKPCSNRQITRKAALMIFIAALYHCKKIAPQTIVDWLRELLINEDHKDTVAGVELLRALGIRSSWAIQKARAVLRVNAASVADAASQLHDIIVRDGMDRLLGTLTETNAAELVPQLEPFLASGDDAKIVADCIVAKALSDPNLAKSCVTLCVDGGLPQTIVDWLRELFVDEDYADAVLGVELLDALGVRSSMRREVFVDGVKWLLRRHEHHNNADLLLDKIGSFCNVGALLAEQLPENQSLLDNVTSLKPINATTAQREFIQTCIDMYPCSAPSPHCWIGDTPIRTPDDVLSLIANVYYQTAVLGALRWKLIEVYNAMRRRLSACVPRDEEAEPDDTNEDAVYAFTQWIGAQQADMDSDASRVSNEHLLQQYSTLRSHFDNVWEQHHRCTTDPVYQEMVSVFQERMW